MQNIGIICEYNPFHQGHAYHLHETRRISQTCKIICVMSGSFSQRGEPCITDKWTRARMAVEHGADLVLELPFLFATQSAEGFAAGGVSLLRQLGCVDALSFGSECADITLLQGTARLLADAQENFEARVRSLCLQGLSYPAAREKAFIELHPNADHAPLTGSNNVLALEYLKAMQRQSCDFSPLTIQRRGQAYHEAQLQEAFSSATALRNELYTTGFTPELLQNLPSRQPFPFIDPTMFFRLLSFRLRTMSLVEIEQVHDVGGGLEYNIKEAAKTAQSYDQLVTQIKTKRYTRTRIQRILLHCLMDVRKQTIASIDIDSQCYARVLAVKQSSLDLLSQIKRHLPLITKASEFTDSPLLEYDLRATDVHSTLFTPVHAAAQDFTQKFPVFRLTPPTALESAAKPLAQHAPPPE